MTGNIDFIEKLFDDSYDNIINKISTWVQHRLIEYNVSDDEVTVTGIDIVGSMRFGEPTVDSDLDVIVTYTGTMREDSLFNILAEDPQEYFYVEASTGVDSKIIVDFNPIKDGDLDYEVAKRSTFKKER